MTISKRCLQKDKKESESVTEVSEETTEIGLKNDFTFYSNIINSGSMSNLENLLLGLGGTLSWITFC